MESEQDLYTLPHGFEQTIVKSHRSVRWRVRGPDGHVYPSPVARVPFVCSRDDMSVPLPGFCAGGTPHLLRGGKIVLVAKTDAPCSPAVALRSMCCAESGSICRPCDPDVFVSTAGCLGSVASFAKLKVCEGLRTWSMLAPQPLQVTVVSDQEAHLDITPVLAPGCLCQGWLTITGFDCSGFDVFLGDVQVETRPLDAPVCNRLFCSVARVRSEKEEFKLGTWNMPVDGFVSAMVIHTQHFPVDDPVCGVTCSLMLGCCNDPVVFEAPALYLPNQGQTFVLDIASWRASVTGGPYIDDADAAADAAADAVAGAEADVSGSEYCVQVNVAPVPLDVARQTWFDQRIAMNFDRVEWFAITPRLASGAPLPAECMLYVSSLAHNIFAFDAMLQGFRYSH